MKIGEEQLVDDVMTEHPATIAVFLRWHLHCVGCPAGRIHTVSDACLEHDVDLDLFLADLQAAAEAARGAGGRERAAGDRSAGEQAAQGGG